MAERLPRWAFASSPCASATSTTSGRGAAATARCSASPATPTWSRPAPLDQWHSPPFEPEIRDGLLYGRGACDMKGSLAAMITATERFIAAHPDHKGSIAYLITSDEEGPSITARCVWSRPCPPAANDRLRPGRRALQPRILGDIVKNGRRGSLNGVLTQGARQAGPRRLPAAGRQPGAPRATGADRALRRGALGPGQRALPAHQLSDLQPQRRHRRRERHPRRTDRRFNWRFSTELTPGGIQQRTEAILDRHGLDSTTSSDWRLSGKPFLTPPARWSSRPRRHRGRDRPLHHPVHQRRHLRRALHRPHRRPGAGTRPHQRHHPQGQRVRRRWEPERMAASQRCHPRIAKRLWHSVRPSSHGRRVSDPS
jgi:succinyl-diaminopimelate desuccinylase